LALGACVVCLERAFWRTLEATYTNGRKILTGIDFAKQASRLLTELDAGNARLDELTRVEESSPKV
jgi:hypothetical protein